MQCFAIWCFYSLNRTPLPNRVDQRSQIGRAASGRHSILGDRMRKVYLALLALSCLLPFSVMAAETSQIETIPVSQIRAGMHGVAYTVFAGTQPEAMDVEVLGILHDMNGPKSDLILVRLHGAKVEYTGVVAG